MGNSKPPPDGRTLKSYTLVSARNAAGLTRKDLAAQHGYKDSSRVAHFENGTKTLTDDQLEEIAATAGVSPEGVGLLHLAHRVLLLGADDEGAAGPLDPTPEERWGMRCSAAAGAWALAETLFDRFRARARAKRAQAAIRQAKRDWAWLAPVWRQYGRDLVRVNPALRTPALAAEICEASERAAANDVREALALARFAVFVAEQVPDAARRARAIGYCQGFVANALRVGGKLDDAGSELAQAWKQWGVGDPREPEILPEWRLPDLETSLRRTQGRFQEALACSQRAFALGGDDPAVAGRILLKREFIFYALGDTGGALAVLLQAAPFVEAKGEPRQLFALHFNVVDNYCELGRYDEAAEWLPGVRSLAIEQANALDLLRVQWLKAKVDAGQGRVSDAIAGLEEVCGEFSTRNLPVEAALSSLDLAVLLLELKRTAEVKQLAVRMSWIFTASGIAEKALASLALFCKAAKQEVATVELAKRVIKELATSRCAATPA